jgi:nucleoside-diphosphate-sugar epimerase
MKKILVTGVNGFIGQNIYRELIKLNYFVRGALRSLDSVLINNDIKYISVGNIDAETNWDYALEEIDCVIHCAGKAHAINKKVELDVYRVVNRDGTKHLAEQAAKAGVKRLIFLSSVKVNGESTDKSNGTKIFTHNDIPNPQDNYAISKFEAEQALWEVASKTGLEVVVVRLPLVYGFGVKGNLDRLIKFVHSKNPLPFGGIKNKRSLIGIDNLLDVLVRCAEHPDIAGKTFLVSDGENLSTPELIRLIASAIDQPAKLFTLPTFLLKLLSFIIGKQSEINRLMGSLVIDNSYAKEILNWTPSVSVQIGIRKMVKGE